MDMLNVLWLQGLTCGGDTMSFMNAEEPDLVELIKDQGINLAWHPSLSPEVGGNAIKIIKKHINGSLDVLVVEGAIARGPSGTGRYHLIGEKPFKDVIFKAAQAARYVIAVGACACWGGIPAAEPNSIEATGLQFHKDKKGGFLGAKYRSRGGFPVINISGCPAHPNWITHTLVAIAMDNSNQIKLDRYNRPAEFFSSLSHEGCTRALYHEYKMAAENFGDKGCLFFELGCRGPIAYSSCNELLWNQQSTKPRAGVPCLGCTEPEFPDYPESGFFRRYAITPALGVRMLPYLISVPFARLVAPGQEHKSRKD
jgi:hydrogenase small subunit